MRRRVVITGVGCVTPLGHRSRRCGAACKRGESGVGYTTIFDASNFPTRISAEVRGFDISEVGEDPARWKHRGRHTKFAAGAAKKAVAIRASTTASTIRPASAFIWAAAKGSRISTVSRHDDGGARRRKQFDLARFSRTAWKCFIHRPNWSRSRTCRPAIWPACSTPRGRISIA